MAADDVHPVPGAREMRPRRSRAFVLDDRVGLALVVLWAIATAACTAARPGELLELALIGAAGAVAWLLVRGLEVTPALAALLAAAFAAPLLNTWPVRVYDSARAGTSSAVWAVTGVASLLVLAAAVLHRDWRRPVSRLFTAIAALVALAAVTSSIASAHPAVAAANAWVSLVVPVLLALLVAQVVRDLRTAAALLGVTVVAAGVPASVGLAAYLLEFGFPTSANALVAVKTVLYRPHFFQDVTFGNVDHLTTFALLLLAPAAAFTVLRVGRTLRAAAAVIAVELAAMLILGLSRSALAVAVGVGGLFAAGVAGVRWRRAVFPAALTALLLAISLTPAVRHSFVQLVPVRGIAPPTNSSPVAPVAPGKTTKGIRPTVPTPAPTAGATSEQIRVSAIRTGIRVFEHHAPWGVGTAEYLAYDPVHTAPHSLAVQLLAENGVFGLAAYVLLGVFLLVAGARTILRDRGKPDRLVLRLGCVAGALGLYGEGAFAGVALSVGPVAVWAMLLWLLVGLLAATPAAEAADA